MMHRRTLLKLSALGALVKASPVTAFAASQTQPPVLVLVELNGGNDSLNTVIPLEQLSAYQRLRPQLGLNQDERITLDKQFAIHRSLAPLLAVWQAGELALAHGLGYPMPNRSHFRAIEIWDTGSAADQYLDNGWLAGIAPKIALDDLDAMIFGRNTRPFSGGQCSYISLESINSFMQQAGRIEDVVAQTTNPALRHLLGLQGTITQSDTLLRRRLAQGMKLHETFPGSRFGRQLGDVAKAIRLDLGIPAFKVALGSFDTHRNQRPIHARLLKQLSQGLMALRAELTRSGDWRNVLVITYSEFGRRAAQNGSGGTDHGTAATHFVLGGRVKGGHIGTHPDLNALQDQDMTFGTDFRQLYQTVVSEWWRRPDLKIPGGHWSTLDLVHPEPIKA